VSAVASIKRGATDLLPAAPRRVRIGMPQMNAGGLSEGWLYRACGDLHWEAIGRELGVSTDGFRGEAGDRLYPTVVALRARYGGPLSDVLENDVLDLDVRVAPCGRACAHGRLALSVGGQASSVELLTTFALHDRRTGALRMAVPAPELARRWRPLGEPPVIAGLAKSARAGLPLDDDFSGPLLARRPEPLGRRTYEPSPYADYNGAGLLYFAAYPTIADTAERALINALGLAPPLDWALAASVVRRDVFFYANLPLGESLVAELGSFERSGDSAQSHVWLLRERDGARMADLVTERRIVRRR
jgi:probable biosynthetic protein (TIGR04098 family)